MRYLRRDEGSGGRSRNYSRRKYGKNRTNGIPGTSPYMPQSKGGKHSKAPKGPKRYKNGYLGTDNYWPPSDWDDGWYDDDWDDDWWDFGDTSPQLPYCPNGSMQETGMGPCMATQKRIRGVHACPSGTLGWYRRGRCVVW